MARVLAQLGWNAERIARIDRTANMDVMTHLDPETKVLYADAGNAVAVCGNVFVNVMREAQTLERLRELRRHIERHVARWGDRTLSISVLEPGATAETPKDVRDETAAITREYPSIAAAIVIEGKGFRAAAIRAVLAAIYLVSRSPYPHRIVDSVLFGARWLVEQAEQQGLREVSAADIDLAVAKARAALHQRPAAH
jgi:hypothetical protein